MNKKVSYGQYFDELIEINTLDDEAKFNLCMKLYKQSETFISLKNVLGEKKFNELNNSI